MTNILEKIKNNISLANFTTYQIGGIAKFFVEPSTEEELLEAVAWSQGNAEKIFILGGGSNVLVNDKEINGVVIRPANRNIEIRGDRIECGAGANLVASARLAISNNLSGLEWSIGIPGATIGGAIRGNAGAFGHTMADLVETVTVFNINKKKFTTFSNKDCGFYYRNSIFKNDKNLFIWSAVLRLRKEDKSIIDKNALDSLEHRTKSYPRLPNAGSVFKNIPFEEIKKVNSNLADRLLAMKIDPSHNVGAGLLIDLAGLKGKKIGGAKVSLEHGNFIVNTGKASADDIAMLISYIKEKIRNNFNVQLFEEIEYLGFD